MCLNKGCFRVDLPNPTPTRWDPRPWNFHLITTADDCVALLSSHEVWLERGKVHIQEFRVKIIRSLTCCVALLALVVNASAAPVVYGDLNTSYQDPQKKKAAGTESDVPPVPQVVETVDFVRLADGRIVPYGAGLICTEDCPEPEFPLARKPLIPGIMLGSLSPWVWAIPIAAGIITCFAICRTGGSAVAGVVNPPTVVPTPTPTPGGGNNAVPEPATLLLLGIGLLLIAWRGLGRQRQG